MAEAQSLDEKRAEFIRIIVDGGTWRDAKAKLKIGASTISGWIREDPAFREQYARACDVRADAIFEDMLEIADNGTNDWMEVNDPDNPGYRENGEAIRRTQLRLDTRKWMVGKMKPKVYGDKTDVTIMHRKADELGDDELAHIASAGRAGVDQAPVDPRQLN